MVYRMINSHSWLLHQEPDIRLNHLSPFVTDIISLRDMFLWRNVFLPILCPWRDTVRFFINNSSATDISSLRDDLLFDHLFATNISSLRDDSLCDHFFATDILFL